MSRLAKKTIPIPSGVTVTVTPDAIRVKGAKHELLVPVLLGITVAIEGGAVSVTRTAGAEDRQSQANLGTSWSLIKNAILGFTTGFTKILEIQGVGYRAQMEGSTVVLFLGYVHPVRYEPPAGVTVAVDKNIITVTGPSKELVGRAAAEIRAEKEPEPYKGKGIRYQGEVVKMKAGKKAAAGAK